MKNLFFILLFAIGSFAATGDTVSSTFTGADENPLSQSGDWFKPAYTNGTFKVINNAATYTTVSYYCLSYHKDKFNSNAFMSAVVKVNDYNRHYGILIGADTTTEGAIDSSLAMYISTSDGTARLYLIVPTNFFQYDLLASYTYSWSDNDTALIYREGDTIYTYANSTKIGGFYEPRVKRSGFIGMYANAGFSEYKDTLYYYKGGNYYNGSTPPIDKSLWTVGPTGCDYTTLTAATSNLTNGDTIEITGGPLKYSEALPISTKSRLTIYSTSTPRDTIDGKITLGDSTFIRNITIANDTIIAIKKQSNKFKNCKLVNIKFQWEKWDTLIAYKNNAVSSCTLSNVEFYTEYGRYPIGGVKVDSCIFNTNSFLHVGALDTVRYNKFRATSAVMAIFNNRGASSQIDHNYFNGGGSGGEFVNSNTGETAKARNVTFEYNVFDSCDHVPLMWDGWRDSKIQYNTFINSSGYISAAYNHQNGSKDSSYNVQLTNNTFTGGYALQLTDFAGGPASTNVTFEKNLMLGSGGADGALLFPFTAVATDTVRNCVWETESPTIGTGWGVTSNNNYARTNIIIPTTNNRYPFASRSGGSFYTGNSIAGSRGYLITSKGSSSVTTTGFTATDSVSTDFWYDNPVKKDSGTTVLQTATTINGSYTDKATSSLKKAGSTSALSVTGLSENTKYYYRLIFTGSTFSGGLKDTTNIDSVTTLLTPAQCISKVYRTVGGIIERITK